MSVLVSESYKSEKMHIDFVSFMFSFFAINLVCLHSKRTLAHSQAFIQTDSELRYMVDGISVHIHEGLSSQVLSLDWAEENMGFASPIRFEPPVVDFGEHFIGIPHLEKVLVQNPSSENSITLHSISGSTAHFQCSFFEDKHLSPGGNTTFDIVFLARQEGRVENTLFIHTSVGHFKYQVFGTGIPNLYKLRPFLGAKIPLNGSYATLLQMHNPHNSPLQVTEMYSSGGDLHLELPSGENEAPKNLWEILPHETKPVMKLNFMGRQENNHTVFVRIKTNITRSSLILPMEVEVTKVPGIYAHAGLLDFGTLRTHDPPQTLYLNLVNSGLRSVHITSIESVPPNPALQILFRPMKLSADVTRFTTVAFITFTASKAVSPKQWSGKILVKTKSSNCRLAVPYITNVLHGSLVHDHNSTEFFVEKENSQKIIRDIFLTNTFNFTLQIYNISLQPEARRHFTVRLLGTNSSILPQQRKSLFSLEFHPDNITISFSTLLQLYTNASEFQIPLVCYNGRLKFIPHAPEKDRLNFGTLGKGVERSMLFTVRNENPVDVLIERYTANMPQTTVELKGIEKGSGMQLSREQNLSVSDSEPLLLKPGHFAVFSVNVRAPTQEATFAAEVIFHTQYQVLNIPVVLHTADGSLTLIPENLKFDHSFPGRVLSEELIVHSSFLHNMEVRDVFPLKNNRSFFIELHHDLPGKGRTWLCHDRHNLVGKVYFDPKASCDSTDECYVGFSTLTPAGQQWLQGLGLFEDVHETDIFLYNKLRTRWHRLLEAGHNVVNETLQLDTSDVKEFLLTAQAYLIWPTLVNTTWLQFPLTQIGNTSVLSFMLENSADYPVVVQVLMLPCYPSPENLLSALSKMTSDLPDNVEIEHEDSEIFTLQGLANKKSKTHLQHMREDLQHSFGVEASNCSLVWALQPGAKQMVSVGFSPKQLLVKTSLILIRNNLTVLDVVILEGRGGGGKLKMSPSTIKFDVKEKDLQNCDKVPSTKGLPIFPVQRKITIRNIGELPLYVSGMSISGQHCEGYGFRVLNCAPFELLPNKTQQLTIGFTPDFTMSRIQRTLIFYTSLEEPLMFTIIASVPGLMIARCARILPRPHWEPILYYAAVSFMAVLLFCVLAASYFESDRLWSDHKRKKYFQSYITPVQNSTLNGQTFDRSKVFDLKSVGSKTFDHQKSTSKVEKEKHRSSGMFTVNSFLRTLKGSNFEKQKEKDVKNNNVICDCTTDYESRKSKLKQRRSDIEERSFEKGNDDARCTMENRVNLERAKENYLERDISPSIERRDRNKEKSEALRQVKKQQRLVQHMEESDSSSTTTECSSPDSDILMNVRDLTPDVVTSSTLTNTTNRKQKLKTGKSGKGATIADNEFELSTRSKAHRRFKIDPNRAFGGDIMKPSTLELPYKLENKNREANVRAKSLKKRSGNKSQTWHRRIYTVSPVSSSSSDHGKESPPIIWDHPSQTANLDDLLTDLATQTESFAVRHMDSATFPPKVSGHISSYSSIVSSGAIEKSNSQSKGIIGDKAPGSGMTKITAPKAVKPLNPTASPWGEGTPLHSPKTLEFNADSLFSLQPIMESSMPHFNGFNSAESLGLKGMQTTDQPGYSVGWQPSMMQNCVSPRQQRLNQRKIEGEEWHTYNMPSVSESLWDNSAQSPSDRWSSPTTSSTVWDPLPVGDTWGAGLNTDFWDTAEVETPQSAAKAVETSAEQEPHFDPFSTWSMSSLRNIWSSGSTNQPENTTTSWASIFQNNKN